MANQMSQVNPCGGGDGKSFCTTPDANGAQRGEPPADETAEVLEEVRDRVDADIAGDGRY